MVFIKKRIVPLLIILLVALSVFSTPANAASPFKDVKTNHWAYSAIEWAYNEGIISGFPNGTFAPDSMITEAQFVSMLIRFDCTSANSFAANPGEHKASGNYRYLQSKNIPLNGYTSTAMRDIPIKKGQVARVAAAFAGVDLSESHAVQYMYKKDLANGATGKNDYKDYGANQSMSRAEAAVFFQRLSKLGSCDLIGLSTKANGSNDSKTPLPPNFLGAGSVTFVPPEVKPLPPAFSSPGNVALANVDIDIEKPRLIANGLDSTFVTVSLKSCNGDPIDYADSLSFTTTSALGAKIDNGQTNFIPKYNVDEAIRNVNVAEARVSNARKEAENAASNLKWWESVLGTEAGSEMDVIRAQDYFKEMQRLVAVAEAQATDARAYLAAAYAETNYRPSGTSAVSSTDGPDMTVKITAPTLSVHKTDTLTFQLNQRTSSSNNTDCYSKPITVNLDYAPQAELRLEVIRGDRASNSILPANGSTALVKATIVRPGGQIISNFDGRVRFQSARGAALSEEYVRFSNGVAYTTVTSPSTTYAILDDITAELESADSRYGDEISSLLNTTHGIDVLYEPKLQNVNSCNLTVPEVAFIIDSSGSMKRSDKLGLRITKSEEFITTLSATKNIAAHFNSKGHFLIGPDLPPPVRNTFSSIGASGGTNIAAGLDVAFSKFTGTDPKVAILLTDGKSNERKVRDMIEIAKRDKIKVYTIGLGKSNQLNEKLLKLLATETGGNYFHVAENINLGAAYQSILSEILCGIPAPTCTIADLAFISPKLETRGSEFFMNTYVSEGCGEITRVVLRFNSSEGNIDYELADRGQSYFELKKGTYEISNFNLLKQGLFLAYDADGKVVAQKYVDMK